MTGPISPTRRALLGAAGAGWLAAAAGCARVTELGTTRTEQPGTGERGDRDTGGDNNADEALLASIRTSVLSAATLVATTLDRHPVLAPDLLALQELHSAHLAALDPENTAGDVQPEPPAETTPETSAETPAEATEAARRSVLRREESLLAQLTAAVTEAESGRFARLLAATAAGLTQQMTRLEEPR